MALGKASAPVDRGYRTFQEEVAGALDNKEYSLLEPGTSGTGDNTVKLNATLGNEKGVMFEKLQNVTGKKDDINVRLLGKGGTVKVIQNAAINYGAWVMADSGALTKVKAVPGTTGTYHAIGWKCSQGGGAQNDVIEIVDAFKVIIVP